MDSDTWDTTFACLMSVIFLFVVPWDYVWRNFVAARADRWWWKAFGKHPRVAAASGNARQ